MRIHAALALLVPALSLGCAATPAPGSPRPVSPGQEATVAIPAQPGAAPSDGDAPSAEGAQKGAVKDEANDDEVAKGNMWGDQIGDSFGAGGLGLSGIGPGGGGTGEGIGLGSVGTLGHGAGTGTGQGYGSGAGRAGGSGGSGSRAKVAAATASSTGGLPREVIQRIMRANIARIRFCYETALDKSPALAGKIAVSFTINGQGSVASASAGDATIADTAMVSCVVSAVKALQFPAPENGSTVQVTYPFNFSPGDS